MADRRVAECFVVADQTWKYLEPGGIGARPAIGTPRIGIKRKHRARSRLPPPGPSQRVELVQNAIVAIDVWFNILKYMCTEEYYIFASAVKRYCSKTPIEAST